MLAMYVIQTIILVLGLFVLLWSSRKLPPLFFGILFLLFWFSKTVLTLTEDQSNFYLFGLLFWALMSIWLRNKMNTQSTQTEDGKIRGWGFEIFSVFLAGLLYFIAGAFTLSAKGQIIGTPSLSIGAVETIQSRISLVLAPLMSGSLGFIENGVFITVLSLILIPGKMISKTFLGFVSMSVSKIPALGGIFMSVIMPFSQFIIIVLPYASIALLFGIFHLVAYRFVVKKVIWAALMMGFMLLTYLITNKDITAMNIFHYMWNGRMTLNEGLTILR